MQNEVKTDHNKLEQFIETQDNYGNICKHSKK